MRYFLISLFYILSVVNAGSWPSICPEIISRARWGARMATEVEYALVPIQYVIVHHTVTNNCETEKSCSELLRNIQNFHLEEMEFHDIGYNFMVGGDGKIYEGAGWHKVGAHTRKYNRKSLGLAFIGNFTDDVPFEKQLKAAKDFLECGVELGELDENYKLLGARQVSETASPGLRLYRKLKEWTHWTATP
ncbi:peptidoglycan-recognition protein 2-like [Coccinella septempunctata]|uniref:peptidoglycan-recognition protein 2-like n=1 Tax=Coccinella septempunctata TaxID=41139 RepID=UPI001D07E74E|nr:peptidoglycan-recognition protein 2-like [Coccinella septempunctata]